MLTVKLSKEEQSGSNGATDSIDVFVLGNYSLLPKSVISCRPIGVILSKDQDGYLNTKFM
jgi:inorganic pyrophosphatase